MRLSFDDEQILCKCGCGLPVKPGNKYIYKHGRKGELNYNWKGGVIKDKAGYILVLCRDHPYVGKNGYVMEHRLVMEEYLGRYLEPEEIPHHIDEVKDNNNIENLELCLDFVHKSFHNKGKVLSNNTIQKLVDKNTGKKRTAEQRKRISDGRKGKCMGKDNPFYGKKHTPEARERIAETNRRRAQRRGPDANAS